MTNATPDGYLGNYCFVKNAQPLAPGIWLAETQGGRKGKGKIWYMGLIALNPSFTNEEDSDWENRLRYIQFGVCKVSISQWRPAWKVMMWWKADPHIRKRWVEGYFEDSMTGIQFMVRNAVEFIK